MADEFVTLQTYNDRELAYEAIALLDENSIPFLLDDERAGTIAYLTNNPLDKCFKLRVRQSDFEVAKHLLNSMAEKISEDTAKDHYLYEFTDEELVEIVTKPDEWSRTDYILAKEILKERGKEINPELESVLHRQRTEELSKTEPSQKTWIAAGYILTFLGGLMGLFIGWHLLTFKKTLPDGRRVYGYNDRDRKSGRNLLIVSVIIFLIWLIIWAYMLLPEIPDQN